MKTYFWNKFEETTMNEAESDNSMGTATKTATTEETTSDIANSFFGLSNCGTLLTELNGEASDRGSFLKHSQVIPHFENEK